MSALVREAASRRPESIALVQSGEPRRTVTWAALEADVAAAAGGLSTLGLRAGDRVAIALGNSIVFVVG